MITILTLLLPVVALAAEPHPELTKGLKQAQETVEEQKEQSLKRFKAQEQLKKDLNYIAEEIDRERLGETMDLQSHSVGCLKRIEHLKANGNLDTRLYDPAENPQDPDKVIPRLEKLCRELPSKTYAEQYPRGLIKALATELREASTLNETNALAVLKEHLIFPDQMPGEEDAFSSLALFPTDLTLAQFKKLGVIRNFLVKHRIKRPKTHVKTMAQAIVDEKHHVQIGVEVEGTVTQHSGSFDQDYTFNIGDLHIEMTPEWRLLHPKIPKPKKGDKIRVRGWTYYDVFHKFEMEYDPADPVIGLTRATLWEIHPVQDVEILP